MTPELVGATGGAQTPRSCGAIDRAAVLLLSEGIVNSQSRSLMFRSDENVAFYTSPNPDCTVAWLRVLTLQASILGTIAAFA